MYDYRTKYYTSDIPFIISRFIREYDISKANLNVLYYKGIVTPEQYSHLYNASRGEREVYFGNLQRNNKEISNALADGIAEFRKRFIEANNIQEHNILSVKNDSFFLIDIVPKITVFDNVEFKFKNTYTSYYKLSDLEVYYYLDVINDKEYIDIKGINDSKLPLHQNGMILFLCNIFDLLQTGSIEEAISEITSFYNNYVQLALPLEYYREFNADSCFRVSSSMGTEYLFDTIEHKNLKYLNIVHNLNIIRELYGSISLLYYNRSR